ncbi:MAG: LytTR family DNA-binding domain-containing protein [Bacteroidales bacterium]
MDCIILDDDKLTCTIIEEFIAKTEGLHLKKTFTNPIEALNSVEITSTVQLIFLDMEMPEMHGIEFLKTSIHIPQVIVISSSKNYALDAFDVNATDFLLKPISYHRFLQAIQKARHQHHEEKSHIDTITNNAFFFKKKNVFYKVLSQDIIWLESNDNYTNVITKDNIFIVNNTLKSFEKTLSSKNFIRTHRKYIINLQFLSRIEDNHLFMEYKGKVTSIPFSKTYKNALLNSAISFK